jgi:hypothetical protein
VIDLHNQNQSQNLRKLAKLGKLGKLMNIANIRNIPNLATHRPPSDASAARTGTGHFLTDFRGAPADSFLVCLLMRTKRGVSLVQAKLLRNGGV